MPAIKKPVWVRQEDELVKVLKIGLINKGWTVAHLAEILNMDSANLSRMINHPAKVKSETLWNIARKLDIDSLPIIR